MTLRESRRIAFASDSILESLARGEHASTTYLVFSPTSPPWPSLENILPELKTVLPNANFVIEGYVDPREPLRDEGPFGDHTGHWEVRSLKCEVRIQPLSTSCLPSTFVIRPSTFSSSRHHRRHPVNERLLQPRRGPHPSRCLFTHLTCKPNGQLPCCAPPPLSIACARFRA